MGESDSKLLHFNGKTLANYVLTHPNSILYCTLLEKQQQTVTHLGENKSKLLRFRRKNKSKLLHILGKQQKTITHLGENNRKLFYF